MFFGRRKKWNGRVAALLPTFGLSIEEVGPMVALESLDLVYPKGFSPEEAATYLAYLSYSTYLKDRDAKADALIRRITSAEDEWIKLGRVKAENVRAWRAKAREWEAQ